MQRHLTQLHLLQEDTLQQSASSPITVTGLQSGTSYTFTVTGTNAAGTGDASSASNSITATTVPQAPTVGSVTNTCSGRGFNDGLIVVNVTAGATGGKAISSYYAISNAGQNSSGASSTVNVTGLTGGTSYTFQTRVSNANGNSDLSASSGAVTATTVPETPGAPSASSPSAGVDNVSWTAPSNGGSAITNYYWTSSDGKSGNTTSTSISVTQEQGTAQTYNVRADNACGSSGTSASSNSVTTVYSFVPYSFCSLFVCSLFVCSLFVYSLFIYSVFSLRCLRCVFSLRCLRCLRCVCCLHLCP